MFPILVMFLIYYKEIIYSININDNLERINNDIRFGITPKKHF